MATCNQKLKSHYKYGKSWVFRTPHSISFNSLVFSATFWLRMEKKMMEMKLQEEKEEEKNRDTFATVT